MQFSRHERSDILICLNRMQFSKFADPKPGRMITLSEPIFKTEDLGHIRASKKKKIKTKICFYLFEICISQ